MKSKEMYTFSYYMIVKVSTQNKKEGFAFKYWTFQMGKEILIFLAFYGYAAFFFEVLWHGTSSVIYYYNLLVLLLVFHRYYL
jgi:hypothetical protein